jgi:hypothetical protein
MSLPQQIVVGVAALIGVVAMNAIPIWFLMVGRQFTISPTRRIERRQSMRTSWRSVGWNVFTAVLALLMAMLALFGALHLRAAAGSSAQVFAIGYGIGALVLAAGSVRALMQRVYVDERGVTVRLMEYTRRIPWDHVVDFQVGEVTYAAGGMFGTTAPVVVIRREGKQDRRLVLRCISSYGYAGPNEVVLELRAHLANWRQADDPPK